LLGNRGQQGSNLYNNHPYRLVILNGCTTWGEGWVWAWGLPTIVGEETKAVFDRYGLDHAAYVGWNRNFEACNTGGDAYATCLSTLFGKWREGRPLRECLVAYTAQANDPGNAHCFVVDYWKIAGCGDLTIDDR